MRKTQDNMIEMAAQCLRAASIDQASLLKALCDLSDCLQHHNKETDSQHSITREKISDGDQNNNDLPDDNDDENIEETNREIVSYLLQLNLVRTGDRLSMTQETIQNQIDECLDLCGLRISFLVAVEMIHTASSKRSATDDTLKLTSCLLASCRLVSRYLIHNKTNDEEEIRGHRLQLFLKEFFYNDDDKFSTRHIKTSSMSLFDLRMEKQVLHFVNNIVVLLPSQIANAFYSCKLKLPHWATRPNLFAQLVETSAFAATLSCKTSERLESHNNSVELCYFANLLEVLLRHGSSDNVCVGLYKFWKRVQSRRSCHSDELKRMKSTLQLGTTNLTSPRSCTSLLNAAIKKVISELEIYPTKITRSDAKELCSKECIPFLNDISTYILLNDSNRDMIINKLVFSPSTSGDPGEQKLITRCIVDLLAKCTMDKGTNDKSHNKEGINSDRTIILKHLIEVVNRWNETLFINETDSFQQRHVSSFILDAMDYMEKGADNTYQETVIQSLVVGITNRLDVSEISIRQDGMMIAEKLAPILGQELQFDELDSIRDEGFHLEKDGISTLDIQDKPMKPKSQRKKAKKSSVDIDPDEYLSDESCAINEGESISDSISNSSSDVTSCNDSEWGDENIIPLALSDNEEDLRPVPKPIYLQECLTLLQGTMDDHDAKYMQDVALTEIESIVRDLPPDLNELAALLTKELIFVENKYNLPSFSKHRWEGLCALAACAPTSVIPCLQNEVFADVSLEVRLEALEIMKYASWELCGQIELNKWRHDKDRLIDHSQSLVKLTENNTRRWRRGVQAIKSVENKFGEVAPLFFYPLLQGFVESKLNQRLWGGENGGRLLSSLLVTLSTFVDCSGMHPGTSILSSDLFEITWSFHKAQNPEVRRAVLFSIATCIPYLNSDALVKIIYNDRILHELLRIKDLDSNSECRQIASMILGTLSNITDVAII